MKPKNIQSQQGFPDRHFLETNHLPRAGTTTSTTAIASASSTTTIAAAASTAATVAASAASGSSLAAAASATDLQEPVGCFLFRVDELTMEIPCDTAVTVVDHGGGESLVSGTARATNAMRVVLNVRRSVVIDDVRHLQHNTQQLSVTSLLTPTV